MIVIDRAREHAALPGVHTPDSGPWLYAGHARRAVLLRRHGERLSVTEICAYLIFATPAGGNVEGPADRRVRPLSVKGYFA